MNLKILISIQVIAIFSCLVNCEDDETTTDISDRITDVEKKMSIALASVSQIDDKYTSKFGELDLRLNKTFKRLNDVDSISKISNNKFPEIESKYENINKKYAELVSQMNSIKSDIEESNTKLQEDTTSKLTEINKEITKFESSFEEATSKFSELSNEISELEKTISLFLSRMSKIEDKLDSKLANLESKINANDNDVNALESKISSNSQKFEEISQNFEKLKLQKNEFNVKLNEKFGIINKIISREPYKYAKTRLNDHYYSVNKENIDDCWKLCVEDSKCIAITYNSNFKGCYKYSYDFGYASENEGWTSFSMKKINDLNEYAPSFIYSCDPRYGKCWTWCNRGYGSCYTSKTCKKASDCDVNDSCSGTCDPY